MHERQLKTLICFFNSMEMIVKDKLLKKIGLFPTEVQLVL